MPYDDATQQPTEDAQIATDADEADEASEGPVEAGEAAQDDAGDARETFGREYVEQLRKEAGDHRVKRREAEQRVADLEERLLDVTLRSAAESVLADPGDLLLHAERADLVDEDGFPDADRIVEAAQQLASERPHLASRRPSRPVAQGERGDSDEAPVSLSGLLRARAG